MNYEKNYLTEVVCRIDFTNRPAALTPTEKTPFTALVAERFPSVAEASRLGLRFQVGGGTSTGGVEQTLVAKSWQHRKVKDGKTVAILDPEFFALECHGEFKNFAEFGGDLTYLLDKLKAAFPDATFSKIGLRYVNEVRLDEGNPLDWDGLINQQLIDSVFAAFPDKTKLLRSINQAVRGGDGIMSVFTYGIHNAEFPNPVTRRIFILDIDSQKTGQMTYEELGPSLTQMNGRCESIFEGSIRDNLRAKMGMVND